MEPECTVVIVAAYEEAKKKKEIFLPQIAQVKTLLSPLSVPSQPFTVSIAGLPLASTSFHGQSRGEDEREKVEGRGSLSSGHGDCSH